MTICEYIDSVLSERGMSRRKLAINAGISPSSLQSAFERNSKLSMDMLLPVLDVLNLPKGEILKKFGYGSILYDFEEMINDISKQKTVDEMAQEGEIVVKDLAAEILENPEYISIIGALRPLNLEGKKVVIDVAEGLSTIKKYQAEHK